MTVSASGPGGALWAIGTDLPKLGLPVAIGIDTRRDADRGYRIALRALPILTRPGSAPPVGARCLAICDTHVHPHLVRGRSLGLSLILAHASRLLDVPVPRDVVASVQVEPDGSLLPVDSVAEKASLLARFAPEVTRILVHPRQRSAAADGSRTAGRLLEVVSVPTLDAAIAEVFRDLHQRFATRWEQCDEAARRAAEDLFRTALLGTPRVLDWNGVAAAGALLSRLLAGHPHHQRLARAAEAIALRHEGAPALLDDLVDPRLPRSLRTRYLAHWVQSGADGPDPEVAGTRADAMRSRLDGAPDDWSDADLVLAGAVGRALAAAGQEAEAVTWLRPVVDAWMSRYQESEASYALCELIRVVGIAGTSAALRRCEADATRVVGDPDTSDVSRGFLQLALGRAWACVGDLDAAQTHLDATDLDWELMPRHLALARERWRGHLDRALGRPVDALPIDGTVPALLARADEAVETASDTGPITEEIARLAEDGEAYPELCRCWRLARGDLEYLIRHYRY